MSAKSRLGSPYTNPGFAPALNTYLACVLYFKLTVQFDSSKENMDLDCFVRVGFLLHLLLAC